MKQSDDHIDQTCKFIRESLQCSSTSQIYGGFISFAAKTVEDRGEVCNPGRFSSQTDHFGLRSGQAFDLELGWNLLDSKTATISFGIYSNGKTWIDNHVSTLRQIQHVTQFVMAKVVRKPQEI